MPLKKDIEKKPSTKKTASTTNKVRKAKSIVLEVQNTENTNHITKNDTCKKAKCYHWIIHITEIALLIINFIILCFLTIKVSEISNWTITGNWWEENYKELKTIYSSPEYKEYINNEIINLKDQLNNDTLDE